MMPITAAAAAAAAAAAGLMMRLHVKPDAALTGITATERGGVIEVFKLGGNNENDAYIFGGCGKSYFRGCLGDLGCGGGK